MRRRPSRRGATGVHVGTHDHEGDEADENRQQERHECRIAEQQDEAPRSLLDGAAEEVGRAGAEEPAGRHRIASVPPALGPRDRLRPLGLQIRAGRAVEERLLELAPPSLEVDPRERGHRRRSVARDRRHRRANFAVRAARVVAPDPGLGGTAEVEGLGELVRVRARGGVDDRVRLVDDVELLVAPVRPLGALVRAVADLDRLLPESLACVVRVEEELDHLPVALVRVVEVVEGVEEPVLECELSGTAGFGRDVRVDRRLAPCGEAARPALVGAAGIERIAREVEVVLVAVPQVAARSARSSRGRWPSRGPSGRPSARCRAGGRRRAGRRARPGRTPPPARRA